MSERPDGTRARTPPFAFEVADVLGGAFQLVRRSPTLGGSVPLRVAQGCVPLLEGNAWGWQLMARRRCVLARRWNRWRVETFEDHAGLEARLRAVLPVLLREGFLASQGPWHARLARGLVDTRGGAASVFTGLLVRPAHDVRLRLGTAGNRRAWGFTLPDTVLDDPGGFVPLILQLRPSATATRLLLEDEVATLSVLPRDVRTASCSLDDAADLADAHVSFYDASYFETKARGAVVRRYRDEMCGPETEAPNAGPVTATLVSAGPNSVDTGTAEQVLRGDGPAPSAPFDHFVLRNAVPLEITWDGLHVTVVPEASALSAFAAGVRSTWEAHWRTRGIEAPSHPGAQLYFTKYFTPHPPGEPHFFVKPAAFVRTPPGCSTLVDGIPGDGYEILRGVVRTDRFHAVPAVFQLTEPGRTIRLDAGVALARLHPVSRTLAERPFDCREISPAGLVTP